MEKAYYVGLDMGTSSVGWAVTDEDYNLVRAKGKDLWGVRLFPEALTAEERRSFRTSRRRLEREKARVAFLRDVFRDEIEKVDAGFLQRLEDSKFYVEDKDEKQPFAIFANSDYTDKDYHEEFPTIFHLRKELIRNPEEHDIRLVYLALLNIFKHRGHFLNSNLDGDNSAQLGDVINDLKESLEDYSEGIALPENLENVLIETLPSKKLSNSRKHESILKACGLTKKDKQISELIKFICGLTGKFANAFENDNEDEEKKNFSLSFRDSTYDEKEEKAEEILTEEEFDILMSLKRIHDWGLLADLMKGENGSYEYLSEARVDMFEKHKKDLTILKGLYKEYAPKEYSKMFRVMEKDNYSAYVGSVNSGKEKSRRTAKTKRDDFYKVIKKQLSNMPDCIEKDYVLAEIDKETFLPKQMTASNGVIPNQLHSAELKVILKNAEKYLSFLLEKDDSELSNSEKLISMFEFRIPYYVGPIFNTGKGNAWSIRKEDGRVFPWNFDEKIDEKASAEQFIDRMVRKCTYLSDENVLPKNSLLYEKFMVLNELNNLKVNGEKISVELKQDIYRELFTRGKKVKAKDIVSYLKRNGLIDNGENPEISGIDGDFINTLSNYAKFKAILGVNDLTDLQSKMAEDIVFWSTVYGDSRKFLEEKIVDNYGSVLSKEQVKRITGIKFKDWGRLSREFLQIESVDNETGEIVSIIQKMWDTNNNLMQLLSEEFGYKDAIEERAGKLDKKLFELQYSDLEGLYLSAPVKRMTWQTILILKELYGVLGKMPKKIFIEMARDADGKEKGNRKDSRKKSITELYKACKVEGRDWVKEIEGIEDSRFRSKKLYLYYRQQGKCMYTGEPINLNDLFNDNLYDIDHIYPRHFVKDDSIENNLVLVKKQTNAHKSDTFPIESETRHKMYPFWKALKDGKFITEEKFKRLTRKEEFSAAEQADFISRQIVETRQSTKVIAELLKNSSNDVEIVYSKASVVSEFRHKYDLIKCREVNDFHHANDAYLNIVVGNAYNVKFTKNPRNFISEYLKDKKKNNYHMYRIFEFDIIRGNEIGWVAKDNKSIKTVKQVMARNTPLISRMNYEAHGGFADQQIRPAAEARKAGGVGYLPIKVSDERLQDVGKYGGFVKYRGTYFFLVEHTIKKQRVRTIEAVPLYLEPKLDTNEKLEKYCADVLGYIEPSVRLRKIKMYSTIKINGFYYYLTGRTNNRLSVISATQLILSYESAKYVKYISDIDQELIEANLSITKEKNIEVFDELSDKYIYGIFSKRLNPVKELLKNAKASFVTLSKKEQVVIILQILQLNNLNSGADLLLIHGKKNTGVMAVSKKITEQREFVLINKSVTGIFESEVNLLSI